MEYFEVSRLTKGPNRPRKLGDSSLPLGGLELIHEMGGYQWKLIELKKGL